MCEQDSFCFASRAEENKHKLFLQNSLTRSQGNQPSNRRRAAAVYVVIEYLTHFSSLQQKRPRARQGNTAFYAEYR